MIWYITGGERSGKSGYAQRLALEQSQSPLYVATSRIWDEDFKKRVERHVSDRDERWTTLEEEKYISKLDLKGRVVVVDCVTLWLTNFYTDTKYNLQQSLKLAKEEFDILAKEDCTLIIISNELGMGMHAETEIGRKFVELQGWMNQHIAARADKAVLMISGIPVQLK
jgi:adenosylcobinamide kinase/adenosylcobinamide-phosphate guanylyltransferase